MSLFNPSHIPVCHFDGITRVPRSEFQQLSSNIFERTNTSQRIDLYNAIKTSMSHSIEQVLFNFSDWTWIAPVELTVGSILRITIPLPLGRTIFAVPLPTAMMGNVNEGEHCFPSLFMIDGDNVLIGSAAHKIDKSPLAKTFDLVVTVFTYDATQAQGWKKVLYSSLSNLSSGHSNTAILLLATAVELYADSVFEKYLRHSGVARRVADQIVRPVRQWHLKANRVAVALETMLPSFDRAAFERELDKFKKQVRERRNAYAHKESKDFTKQEAHEAFCAAFDLLRNYDRLDGLLEGT